MQFYVPSIGDRIRVLYPWKFRLFSEDRNNDFFYKIANTTFNKMKENDFDIDRARIKSDFEIKKGTPRFRGDWGSGGDYVVVKFPKGIVMNVSRIYIRQGKAEYDSITFCIKKEFNKEFQDSCGRFWVKLSDVNRLQFEKYIPGKDSWINTVEDEYDLIEI